MKRILIIGSAWYIGKKLFDELTLNNEIHVIWTSRKNKEDNYLDLWNIKSVNCFDFSQYDIIVNCSWLINYSNDIDWFVTNIETNLVFNLNLLSKLDLNKQKLYHLSTLATSLPKKLHNSYSFSKKCFEDILLLLKLPNITIIRLPWIFWWERSNWLLYTIKNSIIEWKGIDINSDLVMWHPMFLDRLIKILTTLINKNASDKIIDVWYPINIDIQYIISLLSHYFNKKFLIKGEMNMRSSVSFIPNVKKQNKYINITKLDFENDLIEFLK